MTLRISTSVSRWAYSPYFESPLLTSPPLDRSPLAAQDNNGITQWHPAFLALGTTLEICAAAYRKFCKRYKPQPKPERKSHWESNLLAAIKSRSRIRKKSSPGQTCLWEEWEAPAAEIRQVAEKFVMANCFNPQIAGIQFEIP